MRNVLLLITGVFLSSSLFAQYFGKDDTVKVYRTGTTITVDGKALEKCWDSTEWIPIIYVWAQNLNNGTESYLTGINDIRTTSLGVDSSDFAGRFKILWSSKTNLIYILAEINDNALISGYNWNVNKSNYTGFDDIEIFYQENGVCRQAWNGCDHTFNHKAKAIHLTSNGYGVDMGGPSWGSYVLYNRSMKMALDKSKAPLYTWEIAMQLVNEKVTDSQLQLTTDYTATPLPDSLIATLQVNKIFGFTLNYIDVDIAGNKREHFISNIYLPDGDDASGNKIRNASWQNSAYFGTAMLMNYSTRSYADTTDTTHQPPIRIKESATAEFRLFPNPAGDYIRVGSNHPVAGEVTVKIINLPGMVVMEKTFVKSNEPLMEEFSIKELPAGMYIVDIMTGGKHEFRKIQKQ